VKRGAIFGPILFVLIWVTGSSLSTAAKLLNVILLMLIFLPVSYLVDVLIYRSVQKRQQRRAQGG
jgi:membrane protein implicated in regulation of membrane protease activity